MFKKTVSKILVLMLSLSMLSACGGAEKTKNTGGEQTQAEATNDAEDTVTVGVLSYLNMPEEDYAKLLDGRRKAMEYLKENGVATMEGQPVTGGTVVKYYDTLDAMIMALGTGEVAMIEVPESTADYICNQNDNMVKYLDIDEEKADDLFTKYVIRCMSSDFSFMMNEDNSFLRDELAQKIEEMKKDGTMDAFVKQFITEASSDEPAEAVFEEFDGKPLKFTVTGSLPPLDYVAGDGTFAGFNTAVLADIGKRMERNITLEQTDSIGRAASLSSGASDITFWTRGFKPFDLDEKIQFERDRIEESKVNPETDEQKQIIQDLKAGLTKVQIDNKDIPTGTITTQPYFTDVNEFVSLKQ